MAYDRNDPRRDWRSSGPRGHDDRFERDRDQNERGWFERAGDEIASWFGDDDGERRRMDNPNTRYGGHRDSDRGRPPFATDRDRDSERGRTFMSDDDYDRYERKPRWREEGYRRPYTGRGASSQGSGFDRQGAPYRPMTGDYGRSIDERTERSSQGAGSAHDRHYSEWRQRQMESLDRDYDDYRRENQSRFEDDFSNWRGQRQSKREMLKDIREHMEVVGSDQEHVGTVDRVAGDRIILTKTDPEAGGSHHSLMCTSVERIEGDKVFLDLTAEKAKRKWRDENRDRALFEREDQGQAGPGILNRSFSGTY